MNTFDSDYISSQTGMTASNIRGIPRQVEIPVKIPQISTKHKKTISEIAKILDKLVKTLQKID
jgi:hypothetical protein